MHEIRQREELRAVAVGAEPRVVRLDDEQLGDRAEWKRAERRRGNLERARIRALRGGGAATKQPPRTIPGADYEAVEPLAVREAKPRRRVE